MFANLAPLLLALAPAPQQRPELPTILPMRERAAVRDAWLARRLETVAPEVMRRAGIDMWILVAREYNEDPVVETMLPATWLAARRRTILVLHDPGEGKPLETHAVARYAVGDVFPGAWVKEEEPDQWKRLATLVAERDPQRIGIDVSPTFALADGLSTSEHDALRAALPEELAGRLVGAQDAAVGWLETRTAEELEVYPTIVRIAHSILAEGLSNRAVQPGITTTQDLQWWYRERIRELRLTTWFHPSVSVQRNEGQSHTGSFADESGVDVIRRGDLVHVDLGIDYLGLKTDTQQHAYVLRAGEDDAPEGLRRGLAAGNRQQDILMEEYRTGRTGNEILASALERGQAEGLRPTIYSHPLGLHGHGAGPTIGLWDQQGGVPGRGDYPLHAGTCYAIELSVAVDVPEWGGQEVLIMLEEDAVFDGERCAFLDGRQAELFLIR